MYLSFSMNGRYQQSRIRSWVILESLMVFRLFARSAFDPEFFFFTRTFFIGKPTAQPLDRVLTFDLFIGRAIAVNEKRCAAIFGSLFGFSQGSYLRFFFCDFVNRRRGLLLAGCSTSTLAKESGPDLTYLGPS